MNLRIGSLALDPSMMTKEKGHHALQGDLLFEEMLAGFLKEDGTEAANGSESENAPVLENMEEIISLRSVLGEYIKKNEHIADDEIMAVLEMVFHGLNEREWPDLAELEKAISELAAVYQHLPDDVKNAMETGPLRGLMAQWKSMADSPVLPDKKGIPRHQRIHPLENAVPQEHKGPEDSLKKMAKSESAVNSFLIRHPAGASREGPQTDHQRFFAPAVPAGTKNRGYGINQAESGAEQHFTRIAADTIPEQQARELSRKLVSILERSHFFGRQHAKKLTIRLYPEHLGTLRVELIQKGGEMAARILTSTGMAKKLLDSQLSFLQKTLMNQNIQIEKIEIAHHQPVDKHDAAAYRDGHNGRQEQKNNQEQRKNAEKHEERFSVFLTDAIFEKEV